MLIYLAFSWVTSVLYVSDVTLMFMLMLIGDLQNSLNVECEIWICSSTAPLTKGNRVGLSHSLYSPTTGNSSGNRSFIWGYQCSFPG